MQYSLRIRIQRTELNCEIANTFIQDYFNSRYKMTWTEKSSCSPKMQKFWKHTISIWIQHVYSCTSNSVLAGQPSPRPGVFIEDNKLVIKWKPKTGCHLERVIVKVLRDGVPWKTHTATNGQHETTMSVPKTSAVYAVLTEFFYVKQFVERSDYVIISYEPGESRTSSLFPSSSDIRTQIWVQNFARRKYPVRLTV